MRCAAIPLCLTICAAAHAQQCTPYWTSAGQVTATVDTTEFFQFEGVVHAYRMFPPRLWRRTAEGGWDQLDTSIFPQSNTEVRFTVLDDGNGPEIYVIGRYPPGAGTPGGYGTHWAYRRRGGTWEQLPAAFFSYYWTPIGSGDLGTGSQIYGKAGHNEPAAVPRRIGCWNGSEWELIATDAGDLQFLQGPLALDGGLIFLWNNAINGEQFPSNVLKWDGESWSCPWPQIAYKVPAFGPHRTVWFDDGNGPAFYSNRIIADRNYGGAQVSKFDGQDWTVLGYGAPAQFNDALGLGVFDDGRGPALYIAGNFDSFASIPGRMVRWDGQTFEPVPGARSFYTLIPFEDIRGRALLAARLGNEPTGTPLLIGCPNCYANCDLSTTPPVLNIADFACFLQSFAAAAALADPNHQVHHYANCDQSSSLPVVTIADFACFLQKFAAGCP